MLNLKGSELIQVSLIYNMDTLILPKTAKTKYLSPIEFYKLPIHYNRTDTTTIPVLVETYQYDYLISMFLQDFYCPELEICIDQKVYKHNKVRWHYLNCGAIGTLGIVPRIKNKGKK